jgi:hypothetical protein
MAFSFCCLGCGLPGHGVAQVVQPVDEPPFHRPPVAFIAGARPKNVVVGAVTQ